MAEGHPQDIPPKSGGCFRTRVPSCPALQWLHRFARCNIQPHTDIPPLHTSDEARGNRHTDIPPLHTSDEARGNRHTDLQALAHAHLGVVMTMQQIGSAQQRHRFAIAILHILANLSHVSNLSCASNLTNPASPPPLGTEGGGT